MKKLYDITMISTFIVLITLLFIDHIVLEPKSEDVQWFLFIGCICCLLIGLTASAIMTIAVFRRFGLKIFTRKLWENSRPHGPYYASTSMLILGLTFLLRDCFPPYLPIIGAGILMSSAWLIIPSLVRLRYPDECRTKSPEMDYFNIFLGCLLIVFDILFTVFYFTSPLPL